MFGLIVESIFKMKIHYFISVLLCFSVSINAQSNNHIFLIVFDDFYYFWFYFIVKIYEQRPTVQSPLAALRPSAPTPKTYLRPSAPTPSSQLRPPATTTSAAGQNGESFICQKDGLFKDPAGCDKFYQCSNGALFSMKCPTGTHFDASLQKCNFMKKVHC